MSEHVKPERWGIAESKHADYWRCPRCGERWPVGSRPPQTTCDQRMLALRPVDV